VNSYQRSFRTATADDSRSAVQHAVVKKCTVLPFITPPHNRTIIDKGDPVKSVQYLIVITTSTEAASATAITLPYQTAVHIFVNLQVFVVFVVFFSVC